MADLTPMVERHLDAARSSDNGRSAELVAHDGVLRQTVVALRGGIRLSEHNSPPAASLPASSPVLPLIRAGLPFHAQGVGDGLAPHGEHLVQLGQAVDHLLALA